MSKQEIIKPQTTIATFEKPPKENPQSPTSNSSSSRTQAQTLQENKELDFTDKESLEKYLKQNYPAFYENFELSEYLSRGSVGQVYKGLYKAKYIKVFTRQIKGK